MTLQTRPLHPLLGVEIVGVDVRHVAAAAFTAIVDAFEEHSVLLFRGQSLDDEAQIAFSSRFGPLEATIRTVVSHARYRPEISNLANVDGDDRPVTANVLRTVAGSNLYFAEQFAPLADLLVRAEQGDVAGVLEAADMSARGPDGDY